MEAVFFGASYDVELGIWYRLFERLKNERTWRRLKGAGFGGGALLEVGVGSGSFLGYAHERGASVYGCELSQSIAERAQQRSGATVFCGEVYSLPGGPRYNAVVMNHVLEHVTDPLCLLRAIRQRMRGDAILHLAVPNIACWAAHLKSWNGYEPFHLTYFSPRTLASAVKSAGFEILKSETHESFSGWLLCLVRSFCPPALRPARHAKNSARATPLLEHAYRAAMVLSGGITLPLRRVQEMLGRGDEIVILARPGRNS